MKDYGFRWDGKEKPEGGEEVSQPEYAWSMLDQLEENQKGQHGQREEEKSNRE